ncbi:MAG: redoxin family protein [Fuerstiella sp.]
MKFSWLSLLLLLCGSLFIGCGESETDKAASDAPAGDSLGTPTEAPTASDTGDAPVAADPVIAGLTEAFENLPTEFADIKTAYETSPTDSDALGNYVGTLLQIGIIQQQRSNQDAAEQAFVRGAGIMAKALTTNVEFSDQLLGLVPDVFYNQACVLDRQGKAKEALDALTQAVEAGLRGPRQVALEKLSSDAKLASATALPEFAVKLAEWKIQIAELKKKQEEQLVQEAKEELAAGEGFPFDFDLTDVTGKPLTLAAMKGRVCIVDIWGTWCPPCRQEIPSFVKLQDKYGDYGFQMIGLNQEQGPSPEANIKIVADFMANNSMNYPCAMVTNEVLAQVPEFGAFPTTLFIDHHGKVRLKSVGLHDYGYMVAIVETLLQEQAAEAKNPATN